MKYGIGRIGRWIAAGILAAICFAVSEARAETEIRAGCPSRCPETVISRKDKLYIPGSWDISRITLEADGSDILYLGDEKREIRPGEESDLTGYPGRKVPVYNQNKRMIATLMIYQGSEIPSLFITVDGGELKKVNSSKENVITRGRAVYEEADGTVSYDGGIAQLKGRGNNTFSYSKKPYQIKLENKAALSGMAKAKTWVLLANWNDVSLLRNQIVLDISREAGMRYALSCVQADVWINGSYNGLYLMTEKAQIQKGRMELRDLEEETEALNAEAPGSYPRKKLETADLPLIRGYQIPENPEDITGGYIAVIEKRYRLKSNPEAGFRTRYELSIQIKEPTYPSMEQVQYLGNLVFEMQDAAAAGDGISAKSGKHYSEYMDISSFALKFLIEDWCKNYDYISGSQFLYKDSDDRDPLIYAGPAWDYDLSFGNMRDKGYQPTGDYVVKNTQKYNLYWLLSRHGEFMDRVREIWQKQFRPAAAVLTGEAEPTADSVLRSLDDYAESIRKSAAMNTARWGVPKTTSGTAGSNFDQAVVYLKKWIASRTSYMDSVYGYTEKHE